MSHKLIAPAPASRPGLGHGLLAEYLGLEPPLRNRRFVATRRAAVFAGVAQRTVQAWIEFGVIRAVRVGRNYKVDVDSLVAYLERLDG